MLSRLALPPEQALATSNEISGRSCFPLLERIASFVLSRSSMSLESEDLTRSSASVQSCPRKVLISFSIASGIIYLRSSVTSSTVLGKWMSERDAASSILVDT